MKKFLFLVFALLLMGSFTGLFADHAKMLPENVGRVYIAPSYIWGDKSFDKDGEKVSSSDRTMFNLGLALEHGILSWMTAALQWTPGYNVSSEIDTKSALFAKKADAKDMGDLFIGAKMQLVGPKAPLVQTEDMRFAFAPGIKVPLTKGPDFEKELKKGGAGDDFTAAKIDKHVFAAGWRAYFDYLFTKEFFVNLYNETIFYVQKGKFKNSDLTMMGAWMVANGTAMGMSSGAQSVKAGDVNYGYDLTFEIEANYTMELAPKTTLELQLPITYTETAALNTSLPALVDQLGQDTRQVCRL
ncbi:MAG: hypothetical protein FWF73_04935 [Spirochaetes bacterium]|nr:hypothetical protein [Spirochaetota bacterium]